MKTSSLLLAITSALTMTTAGVMVSRAIDVDSDAAGRLRLVANILPAAAIATIVIVQSGVILGELWSQS
jgi:DNA-binding transcriptional regulator/RsmH inhibitor MraZ